MSYSQDSPVVKSADVDLASMSLDQLVHHAQRTQEARDFTLAWEEKVDAKRHKIQRARIAQAEKLEQHAAAMQVVVNKRKVKLSKELAINAPHDRIQFIRSKLNIDMGKVAKLRIAATKLRVPRFGKMTPTAFKELLAFQAQLRRAARGAQDAQLATQRAELAAKVIALQQKESAVSRHLAFLQSKLASAKADKKTGFESQVQKESARVTKIRTAIASASAELETAQTKQHAALSDKLAALQKVASVQQSKIDDMRKRLVNADVQEQKSLNAEIEESQERMEKVKSVISVTRSSLKAEIKSQVAGFKSSKQILMMKMKAMHKKDKHAKKSNSDEVLKRLHSQISDLNSKIRIARQQLLSIITEQYKSLNAQADAQNNKIEQFKGKFRKADKSHRAVLSRVMHAQQAELRGTRHKIVIVSRELKALKHQLKHRHHTHHHTTTVAPTQAATAAPTQAVTAAPTQAVTAAPTQAATAAPTQATTVAPTQAATAAPTQAATVAPTQAATAAPTQATTAAPTQAATAAPTQAATAAPTQAATVAPTQAATAAPTQAATAAPTQAVTAAPTQAVTVAPTQAATAAPTRAVVVPPPRRVITTAAPTQAATVSPTQAATVVPTQAVSAAPTVAIRRIARPQPRVNVVQSRSSAVGQALVASRQRDLTKLRTV
jgi:hypothetical protein